MKHAHKTNASGMLMLFNPENDLTVTGVVKAKTFTLNLVRVVFTTIK